MQLPHSLNRPEYIFRPQQILNRLLGDHKNRKYLDVLSLPWCNFFHVSNKQDVVCRALYSTGVYDLIVTETIWRLLSPGDTAVDVGANIGYMASIMAAKVCDKGKVYCFEPNIDVFNDLQQNINTWKSKLNWDQIKAYPLALSDKSGKGTLIVPDKNRGEAYVVQQPQQFDCCLNQIDVKVKNIQFDTLDSLMNLSIHSDISVLKLDVEGHEFEVLQGAKNSLKQKKIKNLLFEEHSVFPSPVTELLESSGYKIFRLWKGFLKPELKPCNSDLQHPWEPPNYLATLEEDRIQKVFKRCGWLAIE